MASITLTQGQVALVDDADFERLSQFKWWAQYDPSKLGFYARTQYKRASKDWPVISMHRFVMGLEPGDSQIVDHINGNSLDNRRANLRITDAIGNARNARKSSRNSSGHKGVVWDASRQRWKAQIRVNYKLVTLGRSHDIEVAAAMYRNGSQKYHGDFGRAE